MRWKMLPACPVFQWPIVHNSDLRDSLEYKPEREPERPSHGPEHDNKWGKYQARQSSFVRYKFCSPPRFNNNLYTFGCRSNLSCVTEYSWRLTSQKCPGPCNYFHSDHHLMFTLSKTAATKWPVLQNKNMHTDR